MRYAWPKLRHMFSVLNNGDTTPCDLEDPPTILFGPHRIWRNLLVENPVDLLVIERGHHSKASGIIRSETWEEMVGSTPTDKRPQIVLEAWRSDIQVWKYRPMCKPTVTRWLKLGYQSHYKFVNATAIGGAVDQDRALVIRVRSEEANANSGEWKWDQWDHNLSVIRPMSNLSGPTRTGPPDPEVAQPSNASQSWRAHRNRKGNQRINGRRSCQRPWRTYRKRTYRPAVLTSPPQYFTGNTWPTPSSSSTSGQQARRPRETMVCSGTFLYFLKSHKMKSPRTTSNGSHQTFHLGTNGTASTCLTSGKLPEPTLTLRRSSKMECGDLPSTETTTQVKDKNPRDSNFFGGNSQRNTGKNCDWVRVRTS